VPERQTAAAATTTVDVRSVPPTIDLSYVTAVVAAIDHVEAEAWRLVQATGAVTVEAVAFVESSATAAALDVRMSTLASVLTVDPSLVSHPIGDTVTTVERMAAASPECISLIGLRDSRGARPTSAPRRVALRLRPAASAKRPDTRLNPSAFAIDASFVIEAAEDEQAVVTLCP